MKKLKKTISPINLLLLVAFLFLLSACGSSPNAETSYFVLNPNQSTTTNTTVSSKAITLQPIRLAKYLDQAGIVLQTDHHEIKVAHYHRWAEPLKNNLHRYISQSIGINDINEPTQTLEVHFQDFHGTQNGSALISGHWIFNQKQYPFSYQASLTTPGYSELVTQLAVLLDTLCADISAKII